MSSEVAPVAPEAAWRRADRRELGRDDIDSWDCLGGVAAEAAAGGRANDYVTGDALPAGNRLVAGPPRCSTRSRPCSAEAGGSPKRRAAPP
jgi:hypothetical protein